MSQWMNLKIILTESSYYTNINPKPWLQVWALRALSNSFSHRQEFDFFTNCWLTYTTVIYNNGSNQLSPVFHIIWDSLWILRLLCGSYLLVVMLDLRHYFLALLFSTMSNGNIMNVRTLKTVYWPRTALLW